MNRRKIANKDSIILAIQNALSVSEEAKYYHRLDLVMLAVNGMPVKEIASLYNESPTTISYWTKKVVENGVESLKSGSHPGAARVVPPPGNRMWAQPTQTEQPSTRNKSKVKQKKAFAS